jgi:hypothetical protein
MLVETQRNEKEEDAEHEYESEEEDYQAAWHEEDHE